MRLANETGSMSRDRRSKDAGQPEINPGVQLVKQDTRMQIFF